MLSASILPAHNFSQQKGVSNTYHGVIQGCQPGGRPASNVIESGGRRSKFPALVGVLHQQASNQRTLSLGDSSIRVRKSPPLLVFFTNKPPIKEHYPWVTRQYASENPRPCWCSSPINFITGTGSIRNIDHLPNEGFH